jgi:hypothetical protein
MVDPSKLVAQPFITCHETVKGENNVREKMFLFFPMSMGDLRCSEAEKKQILP